jgi:hypothetical protein
VAGRFGETVDAAGPRCFGAVTMGGRLQTENMKFAAQYEYNDRSTYCRLAEPPRSSSLSSLLSESELPPSRELRLSFESSESFAERSVQMNKKSVKARKENGKSKLTNQQGHRETMLQSTSHTQRRNPPAAPTAIINRTTNN